MQATDPGRASAKGPVIPGSTSCQGPFCQGGTTYPGPLSRAGTSKLRASQHTQEHQEEEASWASQPVAPSAMTTRSLRAAGQGAATRAALPLTPGALAAALPGHRPTGRHGQTRSLRGHPVGERQKPWAMGRGRTNLEWAIDHGEHHTIAGPFTRDSTSAIRATD